MHLFAKMSFAWRRASCCACLLAVLALLLQGCGAAMKIRDRQISFSPERKRLTQQYIKTHYGIDAPDIRIQPKIIVLHWTAIDDFETSFAVFNRETLGSARPELQAAGQANVSIQFLVDRNGAVYRLMPEDWMARHCIGLNYNAIGVENVGGGGGVDNLTEAQLRANVFLVRYLKEKFPSIDYLIGHYEYREFEGHPLWREKDAGYRTEKTDPGDRFMRSVRTAVAALGLKGPADIRREKSK